MDDDRVRGIDPDQVRAACAWVADRASAALWNRSRAPRYKAIPRPPTVALIGSESA